MPQERDRSRAPGNKSHSQARSWGWGIVGLLVGSAIGHDLWGALSGALLGVVLASHQNARARLASLENAVALLRSRPATTAEVFVEPEAVVGSRPLSPPSQASRAAARSGPIDRTGDEASPHDRGPYAPEAPEAPEASEFERGRVAGPQGQSTAAPRSTSSKPRVEPPRPPRPPAPPSVFARGFGLIRSFFFGGNTVVRVGLLVLLVGLTLLAKFAADNALFPIEARLAFGALAGLALVGIGFRQRLERPGFGLSLQGGGIAALYLITFFAFKFYGLIPAGLAFGLFVALAVATAMLSLLQKSEPLVVIGSLGGFLAPVLASTGGGSHVALFSYYLLLVASIGFVAWRESWRVPAIVAFVCTYAVAGTWGVLRYEPEFFASTEPFVIAFMTLFTGIAFLHATRRGCELRGIVDGTLVFGTAFVSILIQGALVRDRELGLALSAAGFGVFYLAWTLLLWRRSEATMRPLAEAFLALAIGFATMAIPFAFDEALTTSVAWALEGAGLYWVGVRQSRVLPRVAGLLLQVLGAMAFVVSIAIDDIDPDRFMPIVNGRALSCLALALAGVFIARMAFVHRERLKGFEALLSQGLGAAGLLWWTGGAVAEIDQFVAEAYQVSAVLLWIVATVILLELGSVRWDWTPGRWMSLVSLPGAALTLLISLDHQRHVLANGGFLAWPLLFGAVYFLWERMKDSSPAFLLPFRAGCLWLIAIFSGVMLVGLAGAEFHLANDWRVGGFGMGLACVLFGGLFLEAKAQSPFDLEPENALLVGLGPIAGLALLSIVAVQFSATGDASPLPHLPVLNPVDLSVCLMALGIFAWWREVQTKIAGLWGHEVFRVFTLALLGIAFVCLNGVLARAVHQWAGVALDPDALWDSVAMQVTLSIAWTVLGLVGMLLSSRQGWREAWMGFAGLLGVVVLKLFTVDLSQLSTVARIGTFLAVGVMLLVLGYLSPVPPAREADSVPGAGSIAEGDIS